MTKKTSREDAGVPRKLDQLFARADLAVAALQTHGAAIGVKQNTATAVQADAAEARRLEGAFQARREDRKKKLTPEQRAVDAAARELIKQTKNLVAREFGTGYNQSWGQVGFTGSLRMPRTLGEREALVERIAAFLAQDPRFQNEGLDVTAATARELHARFTAARAATQNVRAETRDLSEARAAARDRLRKRLSSLGSELTLLLPADDSRWHLFGMTPPAERRAARKTARNTAPATAADGAPAPRIEAVASLPAAVAANGTKPAELSA